MAAECRFRPLAAADLEQVRHWRNQDRVRRCMFRDTRIAEDEHRAWFEGLQGDPRRRSFLFLWRGEGQGVMNFTEMEENGNCAWGFYRGRTEGPRGLGLAMGYLALDLAFGPLQRRQVSAAVRPENAGSLAFHRRLGFIEGSPETDRPAAVSARHFRLLREDWEDMRRALAPLLFGLAPASADIGQ